MLFTEKQAPPPKKDGTNPPDLIIYPKHIEVIYDYTTEAAHSFIQEIREALELSISGPVMFRDLREYTDLDGDMLLWLVAEQ